MTARGSRQWTSGFAVTGLLLFLAGSAAALWGPTGGVARLQSDTKAAGDFDGWEAGIIAFGPSGEGFWHLNYARLDQAEGAARISRAAARLNFTVLGGPAFLSYAGAGGARNWVDDGVNRTTRWTYGAQAGLLIAPARLPDLLRRRDPTGSTKAAGRIGSMPGAFLIGAEAGVTRGASPLRGWEFRAFATLIY